MADLTVVDLFSGIGGLSLGFEMADFTCVAGVEQNPHHKAAFKDVHPEANIDFSDVAGLSGRTLLNTIGFARGEIDVLVGGPPCQPFSLAGKRRGANDHRGHLIDHFIRLIGEILPRAFVMENVVGLTSIHQGAFLRRVLGDMSSLGYEIWGPKILNAADYGVPQLRRRVLIVGTKKRAPFAWPVPTHFPQDRDVPTLPLPTAKPFVTVHDAIADLPCNGHLPDDLNVGDHVALSYASERTNSYQSLMRGRKRKVTGNRVSEHEPQILKIISLDALPEGKEEPTTRYRRLYWHRPSFTIRAGSGTFTALRPIHPERPRVITIREAARLQSFPDSVDFSPIKKWAYQQIGNAVPPLLGRAIAQSLREHLSQTGARA